MSGSALKYQGVIHEQFQDHQAFESARDRCVQKIVINYNNTDSALKRDGSWTIELHQRTAAATGNERAKYTSAGIIPMGAGADWDDHPRNIPVATVGAARVRAIAACRNRIRRVTVANPNRIPSTRTLVPGTATSFTDFTGTYDAFDRYVQLYSMVTPAGGGPLVRDWGPLVYYDWLSYFSWEGRFYLLADGTRSDYFRIFMPDHMNPRYDVTNVPLARDRPTSTDLSLLKLSLEHRFQFDMLDPLMNLCSVMVFTVKPPPVERGTYEVIAKFEGDTDDRTASEYVTQIRGHFAVGHIKNKEKQVSEFRNYLGAKPKKWLKTLLALWKTQGKEYNMENIFADFEQQYTDQTRKTRFDTAWNDVSMLKSESLRDYHYRFLNTALQVNIDISEKVYWKTLGYTKYIRSIPEDLRKIFIDQYPLETDREKLSQREVFDNITAFAQNNMLYQPKLEKAKAPGYIDQSQQQSLGAIEVRGKAVPEDVVATRRANGQCIGCGKSNHWWSECFLNSNRTQGKGKGGKGNRSGKGNAGGKGQGKGQRGTGNSTSYATVAEKKAARNKRKRDGIKSLKAEHDEMKTVITQVPQILAEEVAAVSNNTTTTGGTSGNARSGQQTVNSTTTNPATVSQGTTMSTASARSALQRMQSRFNSQ